MAPNAKWPFAEVRSKTAHRVVRASAKKNNMVGEGRGTPSTSPLQGQGRQSGEMVMAIVWGGSGGLGQAGP